MSAAYFDNHIDPRASFELGVRVLPATRGYLVAAGLEHALDYLERLRFAPDEIEFLRSHQAFRHVSGGFFDHLKDLRFTGEVWAIPEGTPVFGSEPLLRVTAPIIEAQIVETYLMAIVCHQTSIATKAARLIEAAQDHAVIEFGSRRAHGPEAGVLAARAAYIGGCAGTSNVEAGMRFGVPVYGTVAHSYIMAHASEEEAFRDFSCIFPENTILLVDTYDTLAAIEKIIRMGMRPAGVRLDSGNLAELSKLVRQRLNDAGLRETKILVSGDLDEFSITRLLAQHAPVDMFAVGTALATSKDQPALGGIYKLVEVDSPTGMHRYTSKFSAHKSTWPGRKQVFRFANTDGVFAYDVLGLEDEQPDALEGRGRHEARSAGWSKSAGVAHDGVEHADGVPLLERVMCGGRRTAPSPTLGSVRERAHQLVHRLPAPVRELHEPAAYPVRISTRLRKLMAEVKQQPR
jgi:nicotinate phosphoribosyltransferase